MEKTGQLEKNVKSTSVEEEMTVFRNLTNEISKLKEIILALAKETTEKKKLTKLSILCTRESTGQIVVYLIGGEAWLLQT